MRTTLSIDDDLFEAARSIAHARSVSIGRVLSDLVRKGLAHDSEYETRNDLPVFRVREGAPPITSEMVKSAEDEV
jgi:hypothetical protein